MFMFRYLIDTKNYFDQRSVLDGKYNSSHGFPLRSFLFPLYTHINMNGRKCVKRTTESVVYKLFDSSNCQIWGLISDDD